MTTATTEAPASQIAEYSPTAAGVAELRSRLAGVAYDLRTVKGQEAARKDRLECVRLRTSLEAMRKALKAPALERSRLIDAEAKRIAGLGSYAVRAAMAANSAEVAELLRELVAAEPTADAYAEFLPRATEAHAHALASLRELLQRMELAEIEAKRLAEERAEIARQQAEIDRQRREEEARQAEERKRQAAELKAQRDAEEAERRERQRIEDEARAEAQRVERERAAAEEARLAKIREEQEAELRRQREEQERAAQAERDRIAAERAELDRKRAEQERIDRERREAEEAEQRKIAAAREAEEAKARAKLERMAGAAQTMYDALQSVADDEGFIGLSDATQEAVRMAVSEAT